MFFFISRCALHLLDAETPCDVFGGQSECDKRTRPPPGKTALDWVRRRGVAYRFVHTKQGSHRFRFTIALNDAPAVQAVV